MKDSLTEVHNKTLKKLLTQPDLYEDNINDSLLVQLTIDAVEGQIGNMFCQEHKLQSSMGHTHVENDKHLSNYSIISDEKPFTVC